MIFHFSYTTYSINRGNKLIYNKVEGSNVLIIDNDQWVITMSNSQPPKHSIDYPRNPAIE